MGSIVLVLILGLVLYWLRRARKRKQITPVPTTSNPVDPQDKPQLHGDSLVIPPHELDNKKAPDTTLELPAGELVAVELPGDNLRTELS